MKVCVFGAGNMGARITEVFLNAGHDVTMIDIKPEFTERGKTVIAHDYDFLVKKGKMTEERKDELLAALKTTVDRNAAADADFVMEVILERMDLKKDLFNLRLQHATNQLDNPIKIAQVKKDIARVKTIIREQQLAGR